MITAIVAVLRRYRELAKKTQQDMSDATGIKLRTLERIESGSSQMNLKQLELYLNVLDLTFLDLAVTIQTGQYTRARDVEAAAKLLPQQIRAAHLTYLLELSRALNNK